MRKRDSGQNMKCLVGGSNSSGLTPDPQAHFTLCPAAAVSSAPSLCTHNNTAV
jgi:hypothetical protein